MTKKLKFLDQYLSLWIILAMLIGVAIGNFFPSIPNLLNGENFSNGSTNWVLAIGLLLMMYPPFVKVKYTELPQLFKDLKLL